MSGFSRKVGSEADFGNQSFRCEMLQEVDPDEGLQWHFDHNPQLKLIYDVDSSLQDFCQRLQEGRVPKRVLYVDLAYFAFYKTMISAAYQDFRLSGGEGPDVDVWDTGKTSKQGEIGIRVEIDEE